MIVVPDVMAGVARSLEILTGPGDGVVITPPVYGPFARTIERLGRESGLWDTVIRTDTEALTKKKLEYNAKNLNDFDAVLFYTGGTLEMDNQPEAPMMAAQASLRGSTFSMRRSGISHINATTTKKWKWASMTPPHSAGSPECTRATSSPSSAARW